MVPASRPALTFPILLCGTRPMDVRSCPIGITIAFARSHALLLSSCYSAVYRISLTDGVLTTVAEGASRSADRFEEARGLALAPRELWRDGDAVVLLMCDKRRLCVMRVPRE
jgi:hypothetical protein